MRRGGLARRYLIVLVALVTGALVAAGAIQLRTSYIENQAALVALQTEKAHGAAARIEAFVRDIERQLTWTTHAPLITTDAALDARQLDALRLQRQAPPITELTYIDASGREQYKALLHEIQFAEREIRAAEDKILEAMVDSESREKELKSVEAELKQAQAGGVP